MSINLRLPDNIILKPCITVFGVGGAGGNAVNNMISSSLEGAKFVVANTDAQALEYSLAERKIQLGENITRGLGAGASPEVGRAAAEEAMESILENLHGSNMVFITAGMGGGTGTGAAPVIARAAKENGVLTVGVVTKPFHFEGSHRMKMAELGLHELQKYVDTLIVIPNQNLFRIANERTTFADAFKMADDVLHAGVRGVTDLMIMPGLINLDFADIRAVMSEMGKAMMGTGEAEGDRRAISAAEAAISNPLLDNCSMKGARGVLINITGGPDMTLFEVDEAANRIRDEVDPDANIIFGSTYNPELEGRIRVSVVATGIDSANSEQKTNKHFINSANSLVSELARKAEGFATAKREEQVATVQSSIEQAVRQNVQQQVMTQFNNILTEEEEDTSTFNDEYADDYNPTKVSDNKFPQNVNYSFNAPSLQARKEASSFSANTLQAPVEPSKIKPEEKASSNKMGFGLFGRMANSVGLRQNQGSAADSIRPTYRGVNKEEEKEFADAAVGNEYAGDDMLDIPAFLRRKK